MAQSVPLQSTARVTITTGDVGEGQVSTTLSVDLDASKHPRVENASFDMALSRIAFPEDTDLGIVAVVTQVEVEEWGVDEDLAITINTRPGLIGYFGNANHDGIPDKMRQLIEGGPRRVTLSGNMPPATGTLGVERTQTATIVGRPLPAAVALVEAESHIQAARAAIERYIRVEPDPDQFSLAVLEALLREVDTLGDELDTIITGQVVTPEADRSLDIMAWITKALTVKGGLELLVDAFRPLLALFGVDI